MSIMELFLIAIGLSMDAFAAAVCRGVVCQKAGMRDAVVVGAWFGAFQAGMPLAGYLLARGLAPYIVAYDHWVVFVLLSFIGGKMIYEAAEQKEPSSAVAPSSPSLLPLAFATSVDAFAVGVSFAIMGDTPLALSLGVIGAMTFSLSSCGVLLGARIGARWHRTAEISGGVVLFLLGLKTLLSHLGMIPF